MSGLRLLADWPRPAVSLETGRAEVERFLADEAALLDAWRLEEWTELFTPDMRYVVPNPDLPDADPAEHLILIDDDMVRLQARVNRLSSRRAHREFPHSRTRRLVTNVRVVAQDGDDLYVEANFCMYRLRSGHVDAYMGLYRYVLRRDGASLRIAYRRAEVDLRAWIPTAR